jgi:hypothetical protein
MQLHLETNELNLLANLLMERGAAARSQVQYDDLLEMVLGRNLSFDADEFERLADLLAAEERRLIEEVSRQPSGQQKTDMEETLALLERLLEKVDEACVMF